MRADDRDSDRAVDDLERLADLGLRRLPLPRAPQTLLPRVMAAVHAWADRPWYARAWFTWPVGWQAASVAALLIVIAGVVVTVPRIETAVAGAAALVHVRVLGDVAEVAP